MNIVGSIPTQNDTPKRVWFRKRLLDALSHLIFDARIRVLSFEFVL